MALPYTTKSRTWSTTTPNNGNYIDDEVDQLYANDNYLSGFIGENDLSHGLRNAKVTLASTALTLTTMSGAIGASNSVRIALPLATGTLQWLNISSALTLTLPSGTFSERILGFTNADGSATLTLSGNASNVCFFVYVVYDTDTPYLMISRSPFHYKMPANYYHTASATGMTRVGAAAPSTWDAAIISKAGALTDANAPCVCIGPLVYATVSGTDGRFSSMNLTTGEFPKWNNRRDPYTLDGSTLFSHMVRCEDGNGEGSTDTRIAKFSNNTINRGYAVQYLPAGGCSSSGNVGGGEFVVNEPGEYMLVCGVVADSIYYGFSKNSTQRTTGVDTITIATRVTPIEFGASASAAGVSSIVSCSAGDILRVHLNTTGWANAGNIVEVKKIGWGV